MRTLVDPLYARVGYEQQADDRHLNILLRTSAVAWACSLGNPDCKEKVSQEYANWMEMLKPDKEDNNP